MVFEHVRHSTLGSRCINEVLAMFHQQHLSGVSAGSLELALLSHHAVRSIDVLYAYLYNFAWFRVTKGNWWHQDPAYESRAPSGLDWPPCNPTLCSCYGEAWC